MYVCYYTYPGGSHHSSAIAPTLTAAPQAATIPVTEPLLVPASQPALPPQTGIPTLTSHIPITVCRKVSHFSRAAAFWVLSCLWYF